jgi:GTA TIM-barrel-like domain/Putative phage tail protein
MATLLLQVAGGALGGLVGGPIGAFAGRALGAIAGSAIDGALLGGGGDSGRVVEGPRMREMPGLGSTEGAAIPRVYGRARVGGELIWATRFEEVASTQVSRARAPGGKSTAKPARTVTTTYSYYANLAIGLCDGPIAFVRRIWADGREIDQSSIVMRLHRGDETQAPDPLIVAKEGAANAPAYRGLAYVVFEYLPLEPYGNRIPQFTFEVVRPVDGLGRMIRAVCLIPGATEFGYAPSVVTRLLEPGVTRTETRHDLTRSSDIIASLDALQALCPNLDRVSLVVSWFGDDLRAGSCRIAPRVEDNIRVTEGATWQVGPLTRATAQAVSHVNGAPAYGGTPSDASVLALISELKARGLSVVLYPFVMMDIASGNTLPDPWTGGASQPAYPWRGRITCHPAAGLPGSSDGTAAAATQVTDLFGAASTGDFAISGQQITYSGPNEWGIRRHILHYAKLATLAGGVDGFIIGSEMVGLTRVRSGSGVYPAVTQFISLAANVRSMLGAGTKIVYAADWTEYGAHVRNNGAEVRFPLDPLWASVNIDAVGIDYYPPISDWRDGLDHADLAEARSIYDVEYLRRRLAAGEAFDWYYASDYNRNQQLRTPITDGAYNKPWIYRAKDLVSWWSNPHIERMGGVELTSATPWLARGKPIWLTEIGIPAVDKGTNSPNVFPDPKSSENAAPAFSRGVRDDLVQTRGLEAVLSRFDPALPGFFAAANPTSPVYGGPMVDPASIFVWAWDARPFPAFPDQSLVWADGANWETGHWITGRLESVPLDRLFGKITSDFSLPVPDVKDVDALIDGYVIERPMSAREALEPLMRAFGLDAVASAGVLRFRGRSGRLIANIATTDLVPDRDGETLRVTRVQETELPRELRLSFTDGDGEYRSRTMASRLLNGTSRRESSAEIAAVMQPAEAQKLADIWLQDLWAGRETISFALSPQRVELEVGDIVALDAPDPGRRWRITRLVDGSERRVTARAVEPSVFETFAPSLPRPRRAAPELAGKPALIVLDLPYAMGEPPGLQWLAAYADPWPGALTVWRSMDGATFAPIINIDLPAVIGETLTVLQSGPVWRWDDATSVDLRLRGGTLSSIDDLSALEGSNTLAIQGADGVWEILTAARAELIGTNTLRISRLLRGLGGSEKAAMRSVPVGARVVILDNGLVPLATSTSDIGRPARLRVGPSGVDHADPSMREIIATAGPITLQPYAPVQVQARRNPLGVEVSFVRRTRQGGDAWEVVDIPLGEDVERYEIDILAGTNLRRTLVSASSSVLYLSANEIADFGSQQTSLTLTLAQMSATVGRGISFSATIPII